MALGRWLKSGGPGGGERPKQEAQDQSDQAAMYPWGSVDMTNLATVLLSNTTCCNFYPSKPASEA